MIYITKPGTDLQYHDGKSNMQLRELQVINEICNRNNIESKLSKISDILSCKLDNCKIVVFVSIPKFDNEFNDLINYAAKFRNVEVFLVSNDPRLKFKLDYINNIIHSNINITMLTNASRFLDEYLELTLETPPESPIVSNVLHSELWTIPSFYLQYPESCYKTYDSIFYCLHYNEMSEYRRHIVDKLVKDLDDRLLLIGADYPYQYDAQQTVESSSMSYKIITSKTVPVVLEELHMYFGVITSRVAEAIFSESTPFIIYEEFDKSTKISKNHRLSPPKDYLDFMIGTYDDYIRYCNNTYIDNYKAKNRMRDLLSSKSKEFIKQIVTILS